MRTIRRVKNGIKMLVDYQNYFRSDISLKFWIKNFLSRRNWSQESRISKTSRLYRDISTFLQKLWLSWDFQDDLTNTLYWRQIFRDNVMHTIVMDYLFIFLFNLHLILNHNDAAEPCFRFHKTLSSSVFKQNTPKTWLSFTAKQNRN